MTGQLARAGEGHATRSPRERPTTLIVRRDDVDDAGTAHAHPLGLVERALGRAAAFAAPVATVVVAVARRQRSRRYVRVRLSSPR